MTRETGGALLFVILAVALLALLGAGLATVVGSELRLSRVDRDTAAAFNVAEAGIDHAADTLAGDSGWRDGLDADFGDGHYVVDVTELGGGRLELRSVGTVRGRTRTVVVVLRLGGGWDYAIYSGTDLQLKHDNVITGDIYVGGDLDLEHAAATLTLDGSLAVSGTIEGEENIDATGSVTTGADSLPLPDFDENYYRDNARETYTDDQIFEDWTFDVEDEIIFCDTDTVQVSGTVTGTGTIFCTGSVIVERDIVYADASSRLVLIGVTEIEVRQNHPHVEAQLCSPGRVIIKGGQASVYGTIIADVVDIRGGDVVIEVDERLPPELFPPGVGSGFELESWQEG